MNILVKFPTRGRPQQFLNTLLAWLEKVSGRHPMQVVVTLDVDDMSMQTHGVREVLDSIPEVGYRYGIHGTKVEAINADMDLADPGWELLVLASDDMVPECDGWDDVMASDMCTQFPDGDGALWYFDGYCKSVCTLSVMGRQWYDRFGYIYHPAYTSLWCDNEHTEVAKRAGRLWKSERVLVRHCHPYHTKTKRDELLTRNESFFQRDKEVFERRQKAGFPR